MATQVKLPIPIKAVEVKRSGNSFVHPDFPDWDENEPVSTILKFFSDRNGAPEIIHIEDDDDELAEKYANDECGYESWDPQPKGKDAFLLAIYDTSDGPIAIFFIPNLTFDGS